jgi:hypothetical protein
MGSAVNLNLGVYRLRADSRVRHEPMETADDSPGVSGRIEGLIEDTAKNYST